MKNDFNFLLTALLTIILVVAADFGTLAGGLDALRTATETIGESPVGKSLAEFKKSESSFWSALKGTRSNSGDLAEVLARPPVEAPPPIPVSSDKVKPPVKFLLIGDSMMLVGFGPALENSLLAQKGFTVVREGVYSTGLNRIDYFDWYTKTDELIARHRPDVIIVMFGGNDGQGIIDLDRKPHEFGTDGWKETYRRRVASYLARVAPRVRKVYWIGHPITGNESFLSKFQTMNPIYREETAKFPNATFIDSWERFAVNGAYRQSIPDDNGLWQIAKQSDGVHVTDFGGRVLTSLVIREIGKDIAFE